MRKICYAVLAIVVTSVAGITIGSPHVAVAAEKWPEWSVVFVAHRGGIVPGYPENTMAAYRQAIKFGAEVLEIDLRGTKDGHVVIIHDKYLDRTTNGKGMVLSHTLAQLKKLDAGGGEKIPTYEEVLKLVSGTGVKLLLDIKGSPVLDIKKVVRLTQKYGAVLDVIAGVRDIYDLKEFRSLNPNIRTLGFIKKSYDIDEFAEAGVDMIRLWPRWIRKDPALVKKVHDLGRPVWTTAGDASREELEELIGYGVNGILTDEPTVMQHLVADMKKAHGY